MTVEITGYQVGDIGRVIALHTDYYEKHWQLGQTFEAIMASDMGEFFSRFDPTQDTAIIARDGERIVGSMFVDGSRNAAIAQLRYFILDEAYQGQGLGKRIFAMAMDAAKALDRDIITLWTQDRLAPALALYERYGFVEVERYDNDRLWGQPLNRIRLELRKPYE